MADTLTIRLDERDREILEAAAQRSGTGLSGFIRALAEAEARRLRNAAIRAEGERVVAYLEAHPETREELEMWSDIGLSAWPVSEWPVGEFQ